MDAREKNEALINLYHDFKNLYGQVFDEGNILYESFEPDTMRKEFRDAALNFAYYIALRRHDIRDLQSRLADWGLSSLGRLEGHVLQSLQMVLANLEILADEDDSSVDYPDTVGRNFAQAALTETTENFFGPSPENRYPSIMVTMPQESAEDYQLVEDLVDKGMNIARINCAHDFPKDWENMIKNIRKAEKKLDKNVALYFDIAGPKVRIDAIYTSLKNPRLFVDDTFFLTYLSELKPYYDQEIVLSCEVESVISDLKVGEAVRLDDGKIIGEVAEVKNEGVIIKVTQVQKKKGAKVKAMKGINFPDREIVLPIITDKDRKDLDFAKDYADVIGFSFVTRPEDIPIIQEALENAYGDKAANVPIVIKAETSGGFNNLVEIIIEANRKNPAGVMVARGDLAVEVGYLRLSEIQQEILWLCEAARIPTIWATQVLESLVKTGIPTRAEISDISLSNGAEVVMLNKGDYIVEGVDMLSNILERAGRHHFKKTPQLQSLNVAKNAFKN